MNYELAFSPCPNDTFMFDAMVNGRIDTGGLAFDVHLADVETLNRAAMLGQYDITKLSYHAYAYVQDSYELLSAGSALGFGNGPLLVSRYPQPSELPPTLRVAIPGRYTTAVALLKAAYPQLSNLHEYVFSDIEGAVLRGEADAGVLIHEGRFTYAQRGLQLVADLGALWEQRAGMPIPLGGIAVRRSLPAPAKQHIAQLMRRSVEYALAYPDAGAAFVSEHAQEMDEQVLRQHIALYVNRFSIDLGEEGQRAVSFFLSLLTGK